MTPAPLLLKAVVFDMDGVIVDSEAQWKALEREFFRSAVPGWTEEHHAQIVGMGVEDLYHHLTRVHGMKMDKSAYLNRSNDVARQVYAERVACADGFMDFMSQLRRRGVKTAVASSSPRRWIDMVLQRFDLEASFDAIACADDVAKGRAKPAPDIYLKAVERLGLAPSACLSVEDSAIGLKAAKAAGLYAAALRTPANQEQDLSQADLELSGFTGLEFDSLAGRLSR